MSEKSGGEFINFKYPDLQKSPQVQKSVEKKQRIEGLKTPNNPADRNEVFLDRLEHIFDNPNSETKDRNIKFFKNQFLYPSILIDKDNIPDSYFDLQLKIARERGQAGDLGHIKTAKDIPFETKIQTGETLYNDQKKSLDVWIDYLSSADASYPTWFKYYALRNITKMGSYNKETHEFGKRSKTSTGIFPDLNREALAYSYDTLSKHYLKGEKVEGGELTKILDSAKFDKIYAFAIDKVTPASHENKEKTEGSWTKFDQGSDATPLYESLQGHGTGWCTAGEQMARSQLQNGDFYVYYTKDEYGHNTIPRIAIRMENDQVAEVRGIGPGQNMESNMTDIAKEKYYQLPGGEKFDKKDSDMKRLTLIDKKVNNNQDLTKDELRFLYEINYQIEGFGYQKDPRIEEIIAKRDIKTDLSFVLDCKPEQISTTKEEALKGDIKFHYGNLNLRNLTSAEGLTLPETINGNLNLRNLTSAEGITFPKTINGNLDLSSLTSAEGLILPDTINGSLDLRSLTSAEGLVLPYTIDGNLDLSSLTSAKDLVLPDTLYGNLDLFRLVSAKNLNLPYTINGNLDLYYLTSAEGLTLPDTINGNLNLHSLTSAEDLVLPEDVDYVDLSSLPYDQKQLLKEKYPNLKII